MLETDDSSLIEAKAADGDCNVCLDADRRKSNVFLNCGFDNERSD
jgi:hypothetical protein